MKKNRKNRKLKFIRTKNGLRLGYNEFYCTTKFTKEALNEAVLQNLINTAKKSLYKHYKLVLNTVKFETGLVDDDFAKNYITGKVTLSLK